MKFSRSEYITLTIGSILSGLSITYAGADGPSMISVLFSGLFVLYSLRCPIDQKLYLVALALPNTKGLNMFGVSGALCVAAIAALLNISKCKRVIFVIPAILLYLIYSLQYYVRLGDVLVGLIMPIKMVANILFFSYLTSEDKISENAFNIGVKGAISISVGVAVSVLSSIVGLSDSGRMAVYNNDPNMLSIEVAFAMSCVCLCFFRTNSMKMSQFMFFFSVLAMVSFFCASRMGLILFTLVILFSFILNGKSIGKLSYFLTIGFFVILIFISSDAGQDAIERFMLRNQVMQDQDNLSNGRFEIWNQYFAVFNEDPFRWFFGLGSFEYYGLDMQAHNFIIEEISSYGIIGIIILYSIYIKLFKRLRFMSNNHIYNKPNLYQKLPFMIPIIGGLTLHGLTSIMNTTMLFLAVLCMASPIKMK